MCIVKEFWVNIHWCFHNLNNFFKQGIELITSHLLGSHLWPWAKPLAPTFLILVKTSQLKRKCSVLTKRYHYYWYEKSGNSFQECVQKNSTRIILCSYWNTHLRPYCPEITLLSLIKIQRKKMWSIFSIIYFVICFYEVEWKNWVICWRIYHRILLYFWCMSTSICE